VCVQTGKSYVLNMILPAMLRRHPHFGIGGDKELLLCRLDFEAIAGGQDYNDALRRFLTALLTWAENGQVRNAHNLLLLVLSVMTWCTLLLPIEGAPADKLQVKAAKILPLAGSPDPSKTQLIMGMVHHRAESTALFIYNLARCHASGFIGLRWS
jgi:hypothetical protein